MAVSNGFRTELECARARQSTSAVLSGVTTADLFYTRRQDRMPWLSARAAAYLPASRFGDAGDPQDLSSVAPARVMQRKESFQPAECFAAHEAFSRAP